MNGDLETSAIRLFADELSTSLAEIDRALGAVEADAADRHPAREAYRLFHALKGAASMVGLAAFSYLLNQAEEILEPEADDVAVDGLAIRRLHAVVPRLSTYLEAGLAGTPCLPVARELSRMLQVAAGNAPTDDPALADLVAVDTRELAASTSPAAGAAALAPPTPEPLPLLKPTGPPAPDRALGEVATIHGRPPASAPPADDLDLGSTDEIPPELAEVFAQEAQEHLQAISRYTSELGPTPPDRDSLQELRRAVHTLKGAAGVVGYTAASKLAHRMEDLLDSLYDGAAVLTADAVTALKSSSDGLGDLISGQLPPGAQRTLLTRLVGAFDALHPAGAGAAERPAGAAVEPPRGPGVRLEAHGADEGAAPAPAAVRAIADRRRGPAERREGAEDRRGHSQLVRIPLVRLNELVRLMTELIVNRATFEQHHAGLIEQVDELKLSTERLRRVTQKLETNYEARALGGNLLARSARGGDGSGAASQYGFDELEFDRYTDFHLLTRELAETVSDIATIGARVGDTIGDFDSDLTRLGRVTRDIQDKVMEFRMVPLATVTTRLERAVRITAEACGKSVVFDVEGAQVAIDKQLLQEMSDPLMHLLRNAVDHGIEPPAARVAAGKPREGRIVVRAYHEGTDVILEVQDDGKGLDLERIRRTVVERGYVSEAEAATLGADALTSYVFEPGFSTATHVTEISGRGVGLDIVKAKVVRLNGRIAITSRPGAGAIVIVRVPMTLAITRILLFRAGNEVLGLPLGAVTQIVRPAAGAIVPLSLDRVVTIGGTTYPVRDLSDVLGLPRLPEPASAPRPLLIANLAGRYVALEIDEVVGSRDAVVKTLGTHLRRVAGVWGATLLGDGTVVLILNPADLTAASEKPRPRRVAPRAVAAEREPYTILIVDDSLSMRHVLSAAVRRAGWNPVQARDGLEALEAVHRAVRPPDLILLDIEMPRMDGYEFLATMRGQKGYAALPIVMLTSRGGEKHREKAQSLGATDYLVKPFHEDTLIETVGRLVQAGRHPERKAAS